MMTLVSGVNTTAQMCGQCDKFGPDGIKPLGMKIIAGRCCVPDTGMVSASGKAHIFVKDLLNAADTKLVATATGLVEPASGVGSCVQQCLLGESCHASTARLLTLGIQSQDVQSHEQHRGQDAGHRGHGASQVMFVCECMGQDAGITGRNIRVVVHTVWGDVSRVKRQESRV